MTDADKDRRFKAILQEVRKQFPNMRFGLEHAVTQIIAADTLTSEHAKLTASHAEAVALLGDVREVLEGCTSLILELDPNEATMRLDEQIQALLTRFAKVGA